MTEPINVFIPAAGLGERLQPITYHIPKPLLPIAGKPVLKMILEKVSLLPVKHIGINLHYKGDVIEDWIKRSAFREQVITFPEEPVLGTGGALKNAEGFLSEGIFLVHNSDILSDIDLERLIESHRSSGNIVTLAVHDFPRFNTVVMDSDGLLTGVGNSLISQGRVEKRLAFTGIAVYEPAFLGFLPVGVSSVVDAWMAALFAGHRIGTLDVSGCYWSDIGTPSAYAAAVVERMRSEGENIYIHPSARGCRYAEMDGYVVMEENSAIQGSVTVRNCILLPGSKLKENAFFDNCIVGPDFAISLSEGEMLGSSWEDNVFLIGTGGSDRKYYRQKSEVRSQKSKNTGQKTESVIVVHYPDNDPDFQRHLEYTTFFRKHNIPVPELIDVDYKGKTALFEDLGDVSLYSWLKCPRQPRQIEDMYKRAMDIILLIHTTVTKHVYECPLLQERVFDYEHFRWELDYFIERFVKQIKGIETKNISGLSEDFHELSQKADSYPKTIIHRDFQSQNIMIAKGVPRLIDYQGARIGPPAYDVVSLLWDPYHRLESGLRERLLAYYIEQMKEKGAGFNEGAFRDSLLTCRLQRHMQALGAYGFLSSVKGKKYFLKHVEEGVRLLREDVSMAKEDYPALYRLIFSLPAMNG